MLNIGDVVDRKYKILNKVGQGGMSVVYLAMNEVANKQWAIKEIRKEGVANFNAVKQGLMAEIEMLKRFNHPSLPSIVDVIDTEGTYLIVMDYIEGRALNYYLNEYGAIPQDNVIMWAKQICDVLGYLHSQNPPIIYRDTKPSNIMLKPDNNITLIDFGTAREYKSQNIEDTTCLGTRGYAAPEQYGGHGQTDARTDIYNLGATLYHLVTGHNPGEPPYQMYPIRVWNSALSSGLEQIIIKCIQNNPEDRYQSCAELMYDLEHYDEIDESYKRKQKLKLGSFVAAVGLCLVFAVTSVIGFSMEQSTKFKEYNNLVQIAGSSTGQDGPEYLLQAISIDPTREEAYLKLIDLFTSDDFQLTQEEDAILTKLQKEKIGSTGLTAMDNLKENSLGYLEFAYETGIAYWYYSEYDKSLHKRAADWLSIVAQQDTDPIRKNRSQLMVNLSNFYGNIRRASNDGSDIGMYADFWKDLKDVKQLYDTNTDTGIMTVRLYEDIVNAIVVYANDFKIDGVTDIEIEDMLNQINEPIDKLTNGRTEDDVNQLKSDMQAARNMLNSVYGNGDTP